MICQGYTSDLQKCTREVSHDKYCSSHSYKARCLFGLLKISNTYEYDLQRESIDTDTTFQDIDKPLLHCVKESYDICLPKDINTIIYDMLPNTMIEANDPDYELENPVINVYKKNKFSSTVGYQSQLVSRVKTYTASDVSFRIMYLKGQRRSNFLEIEIPISVYRRMQMLLTKMYNETRYDETREGYIFSIYKVMFHLLLANVHDKYYFVLYSPNARNLHYFTSCDIHVHDTFYESYARSFISNGFTDVPYLSASYDLIGGIKRCLLYVKYIFECAVPNLMHRSDLAEELSEFIEEVRDRYSTRLIDTRASLSPQNKMYLEWCELEDDMEYLEYYPSFLSELCCSLDTKNEHENKLLENAKKAIVMIRTVITKAYNL